MTDKLTTATSTLGRNSYVQADSQELCFLGTQGVDLICVHSSTQGGSRVDCRLISSLKIPYSSPN